MPAITPVVSVKKPIGLGRWLVKVAVETTTLVLNDLFTDGVGQVDTSQDVEWRQLTFRYQRTTPAATEEDYAMFKVDVVNMTGGNLDSSWTEGDYTNVDAAVQELAGVLMPLSSSSHTLVDVQYHRRAFNPDVNWGQPVPQMVTDPVTNRQKEINRFVRTGPPLHVKSINLIGTAAGAALPYQSAMSVTFKTAAPKHWGRVYLPGLQISETGLHGRFQPTAMTAVANAFAEFASDLSANDFYIKVAMTQHERHYEAALQAVDSIVVDDIPDVIRRRRPRQAAGRATGVATP